MRPVVICTGKENPSDRNELHTVFRRDLHTLSVVMNGGKVSKRYLVPQLYYCETIAMTWLKTQTRSQTGLTGLTLLV